MTNDCDIMACCWAFDGTSFITGGKDASIVCLDALAGYKPMETLVGHKAPVTCVEFNLVRPSRNSSPAESAVVEKAAEMKGLMGKKELKWTIGKDDDE